MKHISSRDNPLFKSLSKLITSARERRKTGHTVLDGIHLVEAFLHAGGVPEVLVASESACDDAEIRALLERVAPAVTMSDDLFDAVAPVQTPTGVLAQIAIPRRHAVPDAEFCLLLEDIQDPGNVGSMLRSAAAAGVQCVYLSKGCADAWSPRVLRAGMGAHFHTVLVEHADLAQVARAFRGKVVAAMLDARQTLYEIDFTGPVAWVIGNEGAGVSPDLLAIAGERVSIPMPGGVESLNAAAAAAVCLFERVRQTAMPFPPR
ncbi:MAG: RNA methyltransferase [Pseudomonadota bacterium]